MRSGVLFLVTAAMTLASNAAAATVPAPRIGTHPGFTRVVLDLAPGTAFRAEPLGAALRVTIPNQTVEPSVVQVGKPELSGFALEQRGADAVVTMATPQGVAPRTGFRLKVFPSDDGSSDRLVLDFSGAFADTSPLPPQPAFQFRRVLPAEVTVVLDAGHGGSDPGAIGVLVEKDLTLDVAKRAAGILRASGIRVDMTRDGDGALNADKNTDLAARANFARGKTLFVSVHANATAQATASTAYGIEAYYFGPTVKPSYPQAAPAPGSGPSVVPTPVPSTPPAVSQATETTVAPEALASETPVVSVPTLVPLAPVVADRLGQSRKLAGRVLSQLLGATAAFNRGVRTAPYYVIKYTTVPAILVEIGFVTHPVEGENLKDTNYRDRIAFGVAQGVMQYLDSDAAAND